MKLVVTHLFAVLIGAAAVLLWHLSQTGSIATNDSALTPALVQRHPVSDASRPVGNSSVQTDRSKRVREWEREPQAADFDAWLKSLEGNPKALARAKAMTALLTQNPALLREAIAMDPNNPHLLYLGVSQPDFPEKERLEMGRKLLEHDPDNGMVAYMMACLLMNSGDATAAIDMMKSAGNRNVMNDFHAATQFGIEDALISAGYTPNAAKIMSVFNQPTPYLMDSLKLAKSLDRMASATSPEEATELRALNASLGSRLGGQTTSRNIIDRLVGIKIEEAALNGQPDDAPSSYQGMTVGEARQSIATEREELKEAIHGIPDIESLFTTDPDLAGRYMDRCRIEGEAAALRWLREIRGK